MPVLFRVQKEFLKLKHKIAVISDTHVPRFRFPEAVWKYLEGVDLILHAGDLSTLSVVEHLETMAPVVAVQGNVEREDVVNTLPIKRELQVGNCRIGVVHILGEKKSYARNARQEFPDARIVVFGHSHIPYNQEHDGQLLFNPGSATDRRQQPTCSMGLLTIDEETGQVHGEIIPLP